MERVVKILAKNRVFFKKDMMDCFEYFNLHNDWLFYRLKRNCYILGLVDERECLIKPCEGYDKMICVIRLFKNNKPIEFIDSNNWVEESEYFEYKKNEKLDILIGEIDLIDPNNFDRIDHNNINYDINNSQDNSQDSSDDHSDDQEIKEKEDDIKEINIKEEKEENFKHGYSSSDD